MIGKKIPLIYKGRKKMALCPFHKEKTPSFHIDDDRGFYHCFGCEAHGDSFTFLMETEGLNFREAVEKLANDYNFKLPEAAKSIQNQKLKDLITIAYEINKESCNFFSNNIFKNENALKYAYSRNLNDEAIKKFQIGYATSSFNSLLDYLKKLGYTEKQILDAGVIAKNDRNQHYDKFRDRLMFPVLDKKGRVVAFTGRVLDPENMPKYMNSPETSIYHKSNILFNFYFARESIYKKNSVLLVEGNLDAISLSINEIENAVAPMGTAATVEQIEDLWRSSDEIIVCFDGDSAGQKAMVRLMELVLPILKINKLMKFVILPPAEDPDTYIKNFGKHIFLKLVEEESLTLSEFIWFTLIKKFNTNRKLTAEDRGALEEKIKDLLVKIPNENIVKNFNYYFRNNIFLFFKENFSKKIKNYHVATNIKYDYLEKPVYGVDFLKDNIKINEKSIINIIVKYPHFIDKSLEKYNIDFSNFNFLSVDAKEVIKIIFNSYEENILKNEELLKKPLEKYYFNNYINNRHKILDNEEKNFKILYSLILERNILKTEIELKNIAIKNDDEIKRQKLEIILKELKNQKRDFDFEFNFL